MPADRTAYIQWLTSAIHTTTIYHNHKENMAWLATAFYIGGALTAASKLSPDTPWERWTLVVVFLFVTALVALFVNMQFRNRAIASDVVDALKITLNKFCANSEFSPADTSNLPMKTWQKWPKFIWDEIEAQGGNSRPFLDRLETDYVSYAAIISAMLAALAIVLRN